MILHKILVPMWPFRYAIRKARQGRPFVHCYCFQPCQLLVCRTTHLLCSTWNIISRNKIKLVFLMILIFITVPWRRLHPPQPLEILKLIHLKSSEKITIGLMTCAGGIQSVGRGKNETKAMNAAAEEPLTLIKSVLISAKLSKATHLEFHILTDSWMLTSTLQKKIHQYSAIMGQYLKITVLFYNAFDAVPLGYERDFVDNIKRCGYVRVFFPSFLPSDLKEILYLDTDVIITGNIVHIWNIFKEKVVTRPDGDRPPQLAALVQNSEIFGKTYLEIYKDNFRWIPHVPPRGVNSGVMFMNLNAMRQFDWTEKMMKIFIERRNSLRGDQQLINVLFHDNLDKLTIFPCQYNFQHLHCEMGLACRNVTKDPGGIQIMHGAGGTFHKKGRSHIWLYQAFKLFNLELHQEVVTRLLKPLQRFYSKVLSKSNAEGRITCHGAIGKYLFKEIVS